MSVDKDLEKYPAFAGLDPQQQEYFFDFAKEKVVHHIDSFHPQSIGM